MNQLIRQIQQAQSNKGFLRVVLLGIIAVIIFAGAGGFFVFREKKMPSSKMITVPEIADVPKFIQADFIDLSKIFSISKFRSGSGHDFSRGSGETCRSMKHYFNVWRTMEADRLVNQNKGIPPPPNEKTDIPIYSPVDGKIISIESEQVNIGKQIYIRPDSHANFTVRLFHIYPLSDIKKGVSVKAGQKIGVIGQYQNTDIAIMQGRAMYISYFNVMPDDLFTKYQALGVNSREELIISKEERDASPLECNGEWFTKNYDSDPNFENFVYLEEVTSPIKPTPSPEEALQPAKSKMQPALQPTAPPPFPAQSIQPPKQSIVPATNDTGGYSFYIKGYVHDVTDAPAMTNGTPVADIVLVATGHITLTTQTQADGSYALSFTGAPLGTYDVCVTLPPGYTMNPPSGCESVIVRPSEQYVKTLELINNGNSALHGTFILFHILRQ